MEETSRLLNVGRATVADAKLIEREDPELADQVMANMRQGERTDLEPSADSHEVSASVSTSAAAMVDSLESVGTVAPSVRLRRRKRH
jgi:hypothetical protein